MGQHKPTAIDRCGRIGALAQVLNNSVEAVVWGQIVADIPAVNGAVQQVRRHG